MYYCVSVRWCSKKGKCCIIIYFPFHPSGSLKYHNLLSAFQGRSWEANAKKIWWEFEILLSLQRFTKPLALVPPRQLACACLRCHFNLWNAEERCSTHQMSFRATEYVFCNCSGNRLIFIIPAFYHDYGGIKTWAKAVWRWLFWHICLAFMFKPPPSLSLSCCMNAIFIVLNVTHRRKVFQFTAAIENFFRSLRWWTFEGLLVSSLNCRLIVHPSALLDVLPCHFLFPTHYF